VLLGGGRSTAPLLRKPGRIHLAHVILPVEIKLHEQEILKPFKSQVRVGDAAAYRGGRNTRIAAAISVKPLERKNGRVPLVC
jgi:hypothetical protein